MHSDDEPIDSFDHDAGPFPSWFWYGRYEAAAFGNYTPPDGYLARLLYWCGHLVGRRFGPPLPRS